MPDEQLKIGERRKPTKVFLVVCKFCGFKQKAIVYDTHPVGHAHKCVSCGKRWVIHKNPSDTYIIREVK